MQKRFGWITLLSFLFLSCAHVPAAREVVLYTSIDEPIARPILDAFTARTGIKVLLKTDGEASKTAGLVETLRAEKNNPQADVFWNNEIFHTLNLAAEGAFAPYDSPAAAKIIAPYKDPAHQWTSNGLRLRMLVSSPGATNVATIEDLTTPALKGKVAIANPAFGTTSGHVAALFVHWGPEKGEQFLRDLKANDVKLLGGNSEVVKQIAAGNVVAGLSDNDDVDAMRNEGGKIDAAPADLRDHAGPLAIPCTVSLIANAKHAEEAKQLIDYLLSEEVDSQLLKARFIERTARLQPATRPVIALMDVDYVQVAKMLPRAVESCRKILEGH